MEWKSPGISPIGVSRSRFIGSVAWKQICHDGQDLLYAAEFDLTDMPSRLADGSLPVSCAVVISSCDAYSDLWTPFFNLFWKYWPDCPFPVYLISNFQTYSHPRVIPLRIGDDRNWSYQMRAALSRLGTEHVLLMLEDYFLRRSVQNQEVLTGLMTLRRLGGSMLRLVPRPPPDEPVFGYPWIGRIRAGAPYRVSTQSAFWRRQDLMDLMRDGESIWQFEMEGSLRSDSPKGYYSVWKPVMPYDHHVIERGKWFRNEAARFKQMGIGCDYSRRPIMTRWEMVRWRVSMMRGQALQLLPWPQRLRLVRFVRRFMGQRT